MEEEALPLGADIDGDDLGGGETGRIEVSKGQSQGRDGRMETDLSTSSSSSRSSSWASASSSSS